MMAVHFQQMVLSLLNRTWAARVGVALVSIFLACCDSLVAADWPQWRGTNSDGIVADGPPLLDTWGEDGPPVVWRSEAIPSHNEGGYGSPVVAAGRVYLYVHENESKELARDAVYCLNAADGKTLWKVTTPGMFHGYSSSTTPCVSPAGRVYVGGSRGDVYCLDAATGTEIWRAGERVGVSDRDGMTTSFALFGEVAILASNPCAGYDAQTGAVRWRLDSRKFRFSSATPVPWHHEGATYALMQAQTGAFCIDPQTGRVLWIQQLGGSGDGSFAVRGDFAAVATRGKDGGLEAYRLGLEGAKRLWTVPDFNSWHSSPIIHDGYVYAFGAMGTKMDFCVAMDTGQVKWVNELRGGRDATSPIYADGKLFSYRCPIRGGGSLFMLEASPKACRVLGMVKNLAANCTSPAMVDGRLYVRVLDGVICYDLRKKTQP